LDQKIVSGHSEIENLHQQTDIGRIVVSVIHFLPSKVKRWHVIFAVIAFIHCFTEFLWMNAGFRQLV